MTKFYNILLLILVGCNVQAEKADLELKMPEQSVLFDEIKEQVEEKEREFYRLFKSYTLETKQYSVTFMLDKIDNEKEYKFIFLAEYWMAFNYQNMIPELINRVANNKEIGLKNSTDLIIWERIQSRDLKSYGHGRIVNDDLFKLSGRANHLLKSITGKDFGVVRMDINEDELIVLQAKWNNWLTSIKKQEQITITII